MTPFNRRAFVGSVLAALADHTTIREMQALPSHSSPEFARAVESHPIKSPVDAAGAACSLNLCKFIARNP